MPKCEDCGREVSEATTRIMRRTTGKVLCLQTCYPARFPRWWHQEPRKYSNKPVKSGP